eukprot:gene11789-11934_t
MKRLNCSQDVSKARQACGGGTEEEFAAAVLASLSGPGFFHRSAAQHREVESQSSDATALSSKRPTKSARHDVSKVPKQLASTRSYVWRGPHRLYLKQHQQQQEELLADSTLQHTSASDLPCEQPSSRRSSSSGAGQSDNEDGGLVNRDSDQLSEPARQRDKDWAALTTWLRMNLHHPRTAKKLVLFVGEQNEANGSWCFSLNPGLSWDDLSLETKLRLKLLPVEAEQAFQHKYPDRPCHEWGSKMQKYKPPGSNSSNSSFNVSLSDMPLEDAHHLVEIGLRFDSRIEVEDGRAYAVISGAGGLGRFGVIVQGNVDSNGGEALREGLCPHMSRCSRNIRELAVWLR